MQGPMTVSELSQYLKLDRMTIYKMLREGRVPASRIGHQWRFFREDVDSWIRSNSTGHSTSALVAESDDATRELIKTELSNQDINVTTASSPDEALEIASQQEFDLAFIEINRQSIKVFKQLRETDASLPVVLTSGGVSNTLIDRAMDVGVFTLMRTPSSSEEVQRVIPSLGLA